MNTAIYNYLNSSIVKYQYEIYCGRKKVLKKHNSRKSSLHSEVPKTVFFFKTIRKLNYLKTVIGKECSEK